VTQYTLTRVPLDGGAEKQVWAGDSYAVEGTFCADATYLHWAVPGLPGSVFRKAHTAATDATPEVVFHPVKPVGQLTIRNGNYYWMTGYPETSTLFTRATNAAQDVTGVEIMSSNQHQVSSFTSTTDAFYWISLDVGPAVLRTVALAGGVPAVVPDSVVEDSAAVYAAGDTLYFARIGNSNVLNGIYRFKKGDTTVTQLVQHENVNRLIVDATSIYYSAGSANVVYKAPLTGGTGVPIAEVPGGFFAGYVGQDDNFLYTYFMWSSLGSAYKIVK
jgi:hypothetical protein